MALSVVNPDQELPRLRELLPASGRMHTGVRLDASQPQVIVTMMPKPWQDRYPVVINPDLWGQLSQPERDLLFLREVSWLVNARWFKPGVYPALGLAGLIGGVVELVQGDAVGVIAATGLTALAVVRLWREHRSPQREMEADEAAVKTAQRRGYGETEAARYLLSAIEAVPRIEGRNHLSFNDLLRCQNLRSRAGLSSTPISEEQRQFL